MSEGTWEPAFVSVVMGMQLVGNILLDYASLFVVRRILVSGVNHPMRVLIIGPVIGAIVVLFIYNTFWLLWMAIYVIQNVFRSALFELMVAEFRALAGFAGPMLQQLSIASLIFHMWLLLFALGVLGVRALNGLPCATRGAQWLLRRGQSHPFEAIGRVASAITFVLASIVYPIGHGGIRW